MKRNYYWVIIIGLFFLVTSCSNSRVFKSKTGTAGSVLRSPVACSAIEAFNKAFYDKDRQLYYESTERERLGSIWTQAIFLEMIMDSYEHTNRPGYKKRLNEIIRGGYKEYDGYNWNNKKVWFIYDDMMWWINALARAYKVTGNEQYLTWSQKGFKRVWDSAYDKVQGGMFWQFKRQAKNACINYPTVIAAMRLYNITGNEKYFDKARKVYAWSRKNLFQVASGRVADHKIRNHPAGFEDYTYNQGTCIGAAVLLYKATRDKMYLSDAIRAADYTKNEMCNENGILPAEGAWNEQGVLKTILAHYMGTFVRDCNQTQYIPWLQKNVTTAWSHRDQSRDITFRDYTVPCPAGRVSSYDASSAVALLLWFPAKK